MIANKLKKYVIEVVVGKNNSGIGNQQCWLGLLTAAPVDDATAVQYPTYAEVTGTGYQRTFLNEYSSGTVDTDKVVVTVEDGKVIAKNIDSIFIAECEVADWTGATYFGLFSQRTGGNLLAWGRILNSEGEEITLTPAAGQIPVIRKDQLKITLE